MKTINFLKTALLTIALFVCGNAGAETAYASVDFTTKAESNQTYTNTWNYDGREIYGAANNNGGWDYVRVGGKSTASNKTGSFTSPIINTEISSLKIEALNTASGTGFTMNNITLKVASDAEFTNILDEVSNTEVTTSMTFLPSNGNSWPINSYYRIEFNWSSTVSSSNRGMDVQKVELFAANVSSVATPIFSIPTGNYTEAQNVTIDCATAEASIYYTLDETEPSAESTLYNGAINITSTTTLKAIAIKDGESSAVASATYTILTATPATIADFLAAEESADVYYELTGTISNITNTTYGNFDLTDATGTVYVYGLTATFQTNNDKSFASLNLAEGDLITIRGTRASFRDNAQVGGAYFVSKTELPRLEKPTAIAATEITSTGFTANWNTVANATSYEVNVWTEETIEFGIANSSFENGLDNWTAEAEYAISSEQAHTGSQSLGFTATGTRDLRQTINNVTPGETITVTYWYYLESLADEKGLRLWSTWEGSEDGTLKIEEYSNTTGAWTEVTATTTVPAGATALNFEIRVYNGAKGYIDDITVTQTNAATTVLTPIAGSPFTATETSKEITDLAAETTYYYNVVAKAEGYTASEASNTISVTTTAEVAEPTITIEGEDLVETEGMYSVALGDTKFSTKTSKTFTLTATGITESIKIKPEIMSGYFTIISSDSEQASIVEDMDFFGNVNKTLTFTPNETGEINAVCTISNRINSEFADYRVSNGEEMMQMFDLTFGTPLTEQWGILYQNQTANITKVITVSLTPTEESTGTGLCNQPEMEGITFNGEEIINSLNLDVVVYNAVGQMVVRSNENINMSSYPAGVYVIKAANGASMKIVK